MLRLSSSASQRGAGFIMTEADENTEAFTLVTTRRTDVELEDARSSCTEGKVCVSVQTYSLPRTRVSQQPRSDAPV